MAWNSAGSDGDWETGCLQYDDGSKAGLAGAPENGIDR